jgi:HEAT repeat protein
MKSTAEFRKWLVLAGVMMAWLSLAAEEKRSEAASAETPQATAWQLISKEAHSKNVQHRQAAMFGLSIIKSSSRAVKMAELGLKDEDESVRESAIAALQQMGSRRVISPLRGALDDESGQVRFEAAKALWMMGDRSGREILLQVLEGQSSPSKGPIKSGLAYANRQLHDPKALAWMGVTHASSAFLGPFSMGLVAAEEFAKDKSAPARAASASMLGADNDPETLRELQDSVQDSNWVVRREAAKSLGQRSCKNVIPDLQQLLQDHHEAVRCMAAGAIINLSTRRPTAANCAPAAASALVDRASN